MKYLIKRYQTSTRETKWFIWTCIAYAVLLLITTVFTYVRLNSVRSGPPSTVERADTNLNPEN